MARMPVITLALAGTVATAAAVASIAPARRPQLAGGGDVLSVVFGDAKTALSAAMMTRADGYFHGGVEIDCHHHNHMHDHDHEHGHVQGNGHHHDHDHEADRDFGPSGWTDPWAWINDRVRAPQVDRHLEGARAVEILPWLWASVRADAHNVEAWSAAWYAAAYIMKDLELSRKVADEAARANPEDPEVACMQGRTARMEGAAAVAETSFARALSLLRRKCGGRLAELSDADAAAFFRAADYMAAELDERGDRAALRTLLDEVLSAGRPTPVAESIARRLSR